MKNLGEGFPVLSVKISRNYEEGTIRIDHIKYIEEIIKLFFMSECKASKPMDVGQKLLSEMCPFNEIETNGRKGNGKCAVYAGCR